MNWLLAAACAVATVPGGLRWLRVAQREHYLAGEVTRSLTRWVRARRVNWGLEVAAWFGVFGSLVDARWGFLVAIAQIGPVGLPVRGVTSPLAWTGRLRRLALLSAAILIVAYAAGAITRQPFVIVLPLAFLPTVFDLALFLMAPLERRMGNEWVERAAVRLAAVGPEVIAITGSYGKTTTKSYVHHLLSGSKRVVASPASYNNRMGLARAINENLATGTEVFVAEMGTYGIGEIADLCGWIKPKVAAIVSIGPVHLERFRSLDRIVAAKSEILDQADVGVICVDHPLLSQLAARRRPDMPIVSVSAETGIAVDGERVMDAPEGVFGANLAVALGVCKALGIPSREIAGRIADLPVAEHRQSVIEADGGFLIVDDTFNSNPAGARSALDKLLAVGGGGRTAVITPGMVELGHLQDAENRRFAQEVAEQVDHLVIVGRTNRRALREGSANGKASVTVVESREEAVEWARATLGEGDAVLYENDLPDHYP